MVAKVFAVIIFVVMFALIITERFERHKVSLLCALATLVFVFGVGMKSFNAALETLNLNSFFTLGFWYAKAGSSSSSTGINWETIVFVACMMIMVEGMAKAGFFKWLCLSIAKLVKYKKLPIFISFMLMSAILSMFIDSITVILFLAAVTVELARILSFDPVPMILSEVFCANLGGSATMCGDPPNIILGTSLGYSFTDFITNTGIIAAISLVFMIAYFYFCFRKVYADSTQDENKNYPSPLGAITDKKDFAISCVIFAIAVILLITHDKTGLSVASIGVIIAIFTLLAAGKDILVIIKKVDYKTLLFFIGLFVVVGSLEETGILEIVADFIGTVCGGNMIVMVVLIVWISGIASAFIDNIPFAATMIPVIKVLSATHRIPLDTLAWSLSMGTDIGGSATPIGASANVVGVSVAFKNGYPIGWGRYCKYMAPATAIVLLVSTVYICLMY